MNKAKYLSLLIVFLSFITFSFSSCTDDDDGYSVDEEWKSFQEDLFKTETSKSGLKKVYTYSSSNTPNELTSDYILWKSSSVMDDSDKRARINQSGYAEFTDSIRVRYEGWYFDKDNEKIIFDTTEGYVTGGTTNYNKVPRTFLAGGVIEGWRTALQEMKQGDEAEFVIPWKLGYREYSSGSIPGFTTLYFRMKLIEIIQMKGQSS